MPNLDKIREQHIDQLVRLAYLYEEALEAEEFIEGSDRTPSAGERSGCEALYARFEEKWRREKARARRLRLLRAGRRIGGRAVQIAACLVLLLGIATPIAIANVESVRAKVLSFLIQVKGEYTELSLQESDTFDVPPEWLGNYFPSHIPEGYYIRGMSRYMPYIEYENSDGDWISFDECNADSCTNIDSEDAALSYEMVNGTLAFVVEKDVNIVTWSNDDRYFIVMSTESKDQALEIARSVKKIIK